MRRQPGLSKARGRAVVAAAAGATVLVTALCGSPAGSAPLRSPGSGAAAAPAQSASTQRGDVTSPLAAAPVVHLAEAEVQPPGAATGRADGGGVVVNDNGGWCWFQDERAIFTRDGRLMVSSVPDRSGTDGVARDGGTEVTSVDLRTRDAWTDVLYKGLVSDDHNAAALIELPERTLGFATDHSSKPDIYRARLERDGLGWLPDPPIHRPEAAEFDPSIGRRSGVTYSNLAFLSQENGGRGRVYDVFRSKGETLHLITSDDQGRTWADRGRIFTRYRAYIRMVSDGRRRIWFAITDGHPANFNGNSLYGGYIEGNAIHRADGSRVAALGTPVDPSDLTLIFRGTSGVESAQVDAWGSDIALDSLGRPVVTLSTTIPGDSTVPGKRRRHEARFARWDGTTFRQFRMADAGSELYAGQWDYTGLSTIDPGDPSRVFLSTDVHPATGSPLRSSADGRVHYEIYEGRTADGGASWSWEAVTSNSTVDNLRPIVPNARDGNWALTWMRGNYDHALVYQLEVVAIVNPDGPGTLTPAPARPTRPPWGLGGAVPIVSDLDGTGRDDITFFGPGTAPDVQIYFRANHRRRSVYRQQDAPAGTRVATGDFDGNGRDDILWHTAGGSTTMWWSSSTGNPVPTALPVTGSYQPLAGDFDGDGRTDILWYGAGSAPDVVWWSGGGRRFTSARPTVNGLYRPVVGDLDGDGRDDILWYAPGGVADHVWWGGGDRRFASSAMPVTGTYRPVAGDVDGDGRDEVLWHAPGSALDSRWDIDATRRPRSRAFQIYGSYEPVIGDFDGDDRHDVLWLRPSSGAVDFAWAGTAAYLAP